MTKAESITRLKEICRKVEVMLHIDEEGNQGIDHSMLDDAEVIELRALSKESSVLLGNIHEENDDEAR